MAARIQVYSALLLATALAGGELPARGQTVEPVAFVTVLTGGGATRVGTEQPVKIDRAAFSLVDNGLGLGESLVTAADGTAVLFLPDYDAMVYLRSASRIQLEEGPEWFGKSDFVLKLSLGQASVSQKLLKTPSFVIVGESGGAVANLMLKEGSILVTAGEGVVTFAVERGTASYVPGPIPDARPEKLADRVELTGGQAISTRAPAAPSRYDADSVAAVSKQMNKDMYAFGVQHSEQWVRRAERGDLTPVRAGEARAQAGLVGADFSPAQAFDQPQQLVAVTAPQGPTVSAMRTITNPAQRLVESGVPGSVIAGQRFRRSIIIGSPGTRGSGPLTVNPNAELLIRLAGR